MIYAASLVALAALWWLMLKYFEERPPTVNEQLKVLNAGFVELQSAIGTLLIPTLKEAIKAFNDFEEATARFERDTV